MKKLSLTYAFILGRLPQLSQAEILEVLKTKKIEFDELLFCPEALVIKLKTEVDLEWLQNRLGGTIKIAAIHFKTSLNDLPEMITDYVGDQAKLSSEPVRKFKFGFSLYNIKTLPELKKIGLAVKRKLKDQDVNSRFVVAHEKNLSSVIVKKENLLSQGLDLILIRKDNHYYLGKTETVQDWQEFSDRDYGRPLRDDLSGMLPPKLARMMLNLSGAGEDQVILDPFCGSGTVVQEALLMGFNKVYGSDLSQKAVDFSLNNLNWLKVKYGLKIDQAKIIKADVRKLSSVWPAGSIDAIVTEPYLGPQRPGVKVSPREIVQELSDLYLGAFKEFAKVLNDRARLIMIWPVYQAQALEILPEVERLGFKMIKLAGSDRGSLIYSRPQQRVLREIFVFVKA